MVKLDGVCHSCQASPCIFPAAVIRKWLAYIMAINTRKKEFQIIVDSTKTFSVSRSGTTAVHKPEAGSSSSLLPSYILWHYCQSLRMKIMNQNREVSEQNQNVSPVSVQTVAAVAVQCIYEQITLLFPNKTNSLSSCSFVCLISLQRGK